MAWVGILHNFATEIKIKADTIMKENSSVMKHFRNSYIAYSELTTFIVASVCNVLILQANTFIDAVIVGNFVSTDAMAVVNLFSPLLSVIVMVPALLAEGAMVAGSRALGQQDYEQVNRTFMVNLVGGLFFALALALSISLLAEPLISLHTEDARLVPLALDYLPVAAFIGVSFVIQNSYTVFLQLSGKARLVVRVTIAQMVINLLLDLLLIIGFGWGLTGAVLAMLLVNRLSDGIDYNYRNGVNCTVLKFYRKNEEK